MIIQLVRMVPQVGQLPTVLLTFSHSDYGKWWGHQLKQFRSTLSGVYRYGTLRRTGSFGGQNQGDDKCAEKKVLSLDLRLLVLNFRNIFMHDIRTHSFQFSKLRSARSADEYALHIAALEWSLDAPITISGEQDILSRGEWDGRFEPYAHQVRNLITFCRLAPVALLADDVGLGKTISAGLIVSELMVRRKVDRVLVVAPKLLLPQWREEMIEKFGIPATCETGTGLRSALQRQTPIVITTYQSLGRVLDLLAKSNFDMVILDEAHKLRNLHGTSKPPKFAVGIRNALEDRVFKYVLMLTATPIQNRLWDLYSLIDLLTVAKGNANPLGDPVEFKADYIQDSKAVQIARGKRETFRKHLGTHIVRTRRTDAKLVFPERIVKTQLVAASMPELELFKIIGELFNDESCSLNGLTQSSIGVALMSSPQALLSQLENMAAKGTVPADVVEKVSEQVDHDIQPGKLDGLFKLFGQLSKEKPEDWRVVVFTSRKQTQNLIGEALNKAGIPAGFIVGGKASANERAIRKFHESPPGIHVLVSTDAGAEGINLQIANVLVNYDLPWNPMVLEQRIGRVQRLASVHANVIVLNLVLAGSVEEKVVVRLAEKLQAVSESLGDIEGILDAPSVGLGEDGFEGMVRKLVVESLMGMDNAKSIELASKSIEEAKEIFKLEKETVEATLGDLQKLHTNGPEVPEITPIVPSMDSRDFVLKALAADGASIQAKSGDVLDVSIPGQHSFSITFKNRSYKDFADTGHFGSILPRIYIPGKRDFERLSQSWVEKASSYVVDRTSISDATIDKNLKIWFAEKVDCVLRDFEITETKGAFAGELICKAEIANNIDKFEKLIRVPINYGSDNHIPPPEENEKILLMTLDVEDMELDIDGKVHAAVTGEADFKNFSSFYEQRLAEELGRAESRETAKVINERFIPSVAARSVGVHGAKTVVMKVRALVEVCEEALCDVYFELIPGVGDVVFLECKSNWLACEISSQILPESAISTCFVSKQQVKKSLLTQCSATGEFAIKEYLFKCQVSGDLVLEHALESCAITGKLVKRGILVKSGVSNRSAIPDECERCNFTDVFLLPEECENSEFSTHSFRSDQRAVSVISGKLGHISEFVNSVDPIGLIGYQEAGQSDESGKWAGINKLQYSEISPQKRGLPSEMVLCSESGVAMLRGESAVSEVSGKIVNPALLQVCDFTKTKLLPNELMKSDLSNKMFRFDHKEVSVQSNRIGHSSEFVRSVDPAGWILLDEAETSSVSGQYAAKESMVSSERAPFRRCLTEELVACEVSGRRLCIDELDVSTVSGKLVDDQLLVESPSSGRLALPDELKACEISAVRLLPDELSRCEISGKLIDVRLLSSSDVSGIYGQTKLMVQCSASNKLILPKEAVYCEITGRSVSENEASVCAVTGRIGSTRRMESVPNSSLKYISDHTSEAVNCKKTGLSTILVKSDWSGKTCLALETESCSILGIRAEKIYLNRKSELSVLRALLDSKKIAERVTLGESDIEWLKKEHNALKSAKDAFGVRSPDSKSVVACVRCKSGFLSINNLFVAVMLKTEQPLDLISIPVIGERSRGSWFPANKD